MRERHQERSYRLGQLKQDIEAHKSESASDINSGKIRLRSSLGFVRVGCPSSILGVVVATGKLLLPHHVISARLILSLLVEKIKYGRTLQLC